MLAPGILAAGLGAGRQVFIAAFSTRKLAALDLATNAVASAGAITLALTGAGAVGVAGAMSAGAVVNSVLVAAAARRIVPAARPMAGDARRLVGLAIPLGIASLLSSVYFSIDLVILGWLVNCVGTRCVRSRDQAPDLAGHASRPHAQCGTAGVRDGRGRPRGSRPVDGARLALACKFRSSAVYGYLRIRGPDRERCIRGRLRGSRTARPSSCGCGGSRALRECTRHRAGRAIGNQALDCPEHRGAGPQRGRERGAGPAVRRDGIGVADRRNGDLRRRGVALARTRARSGASRACEACSGR